VVNIPNYLLTLIFFQTDVLDPDVHEYEVNTTSIPHQEAKLPLTDDEVIGHVSSHGLVYLIQT
jgi:hypothetical protein